MKQTVIKYKKSLVSIICAILLFSAVFYLPISYYRFLRVIIFIGALLVVYKNRKEWLFWSVLFSIIAILFNPILPIYLYKRSIWMPIDIIVGILFLIDGFLYKEKKELSSKEIPEEEKTYSRDRIL